MKVKEEHEKAGLQLNIKKTKIMVSGLITSRQTDAENNGHSVTLYFLGLIITAHVDCRQDAGSLEETL